MIARTEGLEGMKDYQTSVEHLRKEASEMRLIADLATDKAKRETFAELADHLNALADEVERAMAAKEIEEDR
jgi:bacterioferritin (cytochrome b1)